MKRIKKRRRRLRINNPVGFSLFAILCLVLLAILVLGIIAAVKYGPGAFNACVGYIEDANATPSPTLAPTNTPAPTNAPADTPEQPNTPIVGEVDTPTPEITNVPEGVTPSPTPVDTSAPLYGFTIGLDPFRDAGSKYGSEATYNLEFAYKLKEYLEQRGATVVLTREDSDSTYSDSVRVKTINNGDCDIVLRLMCNHLDTKGTNGCYIQSLSKNESLARTMIDAYVAATGLDTRKTNGFEAKSTSFLKDTDCPALVLIMGHWTNSAELEKLKDDAFQQLMIEGLYNGLLGCLKN
ncbi:MAG: N-acetylmuramoyl-L-alanine amidase [Eubacteriales bacterium]|nr:N-acetylmuramoyl-L-alanine amidase [Eubacteriales bacterium]